MEDQKSREVEASDCSRTMPASGKNSAADLVSPRRAEEARTALNSAKRIGVLTKFRFMGDTVVATPFMAQLRSHYPNADIDLLAAPSVGLALANCPYLTRIVPVNVSGVSRWKHGKDLMNLLKQGDYDVAFVLNRSLHCAVTTALSKIPVRVGYANELRRFLLTVPIPYAFDRNEVDCHLDMLRSIGLQTKHALPELWITDKETEAAKQVLEAGGWTRGKALIGVQPGANDPYIREWGAARYASAAQKLADEMSATIVILGGKAEAEAADKMQASMDRQQPINLAGKQELRAALATIGLCNLWLGNDTGLLHCAVAQRIPSVGIFGPNKIVRWGYDAPAHRSIVSFPEVPARDDDAVRKSLDAISEHEVLLAAKQVLHSGQQTEAGELGTDMSASISSRAPYFAATLSPVTASTVRRR